MTDKNQLIELTNNLYQLTLLFPKKEPLRYKMREIAADILVRQKEQDLDILDSFFEVAKSQNWVSSAAILNVQEEYSKFRGELKAMEVSERQVSLPIESLLVSQTDRQEKIMEFLRERSQAQVWELKQVFPDVSKRTLRRDFENLLKQGLVERIGEKNDTSYRPSSREVRTRVS